MCPDEELLSFWRFYLWFQSCLLENKVFGGYEHAYDWMMIKKKKEHQVNKIKRIKISLHLKIWSTHRFIHQITSFIFKDNTIMYKYKKRQQIIHVSFQLWNLFMVVTCLIKKIPLFLGVLGALQTNQQLILVLIVFTRCNVLSSKMPTLVGLHNNYLQQCLLLHWNDC